MEKKNQTALNTLSSPNIDAKQQIQWLCRPLEKSYPFLFTGRIRVPVQYECEVIESDIYTLLGYNISGHREILGIWLNETESEYLWLTVFNDIKRRGVETVSFISVNEAEKMDNSVSNIFENAVVQKGIAHLIASSLKYVPPKNHKRFIADLKLFYAAPSLKIAKAKLKRFQMAWAIYPEAVNTWIRNAQNMEQFFTYPNAIREVLYNTEDIKSVYTAFKNIFPSKDTLFRQLYLQVLGLHKKWAETTVPNWPEIK